MYSKRILKKSRLYKKYNKKKSKKIRRKKEVKNQSIFLFKKGESFFLAPLNKG